jgi:hypothetical protein
MFDSGSMYLGEFKNNMMHGAGVFHDPSAQMYTGQFEVNRRSGWGTFHFRDGGMYQGEWKEDDPHGTQQLWYR